jgi:predicted porin
MKKSLIALAVLAASGAALAQSSVTLSGTVNLGVVKTTGASAKLDAANGASQIVFSGSEDLGGGLKANFRLAQRFSPESGWNDGALNSRPTFQGESTVGLSGAFGAVKLGRALTAFGAPINNTDPWGTLTVGSTANLASGYVTDPVANFDGEGAARTDGIFYSSPNFSGFSVAATVGLKNSQAGVVATGAAVPAQAKNLISLWGQYANGPLMVGVGYEQNRRDDDITAILGTYDLGMVKLGAGYSQVDTVAIAGTKRKNWNMMATMPFGAVSAKLGYYASKAEGTGVKTTKVGLGGEYALSKRTYLYTTVGRTKVGAAAATTGFDVGVSHSF